MSVPFVPFVFVPFVPFPPLAAVVLVVVVERRPLLSSNSYISSGDMPIPVSAPPHFGWYCPSAPSPCVLCMSANEPPPPMPPVNVGSGIALNASDFSFCSNFVSTSPQI